jgi:RNA-binding protein
MTAIKGKQRRYLRSLGQQLTPVVHVGHDGVTDAVVAHANTELDLHELIKIRIGDNAPDDRHDVAAALAQRTGAHLAQVIGRTALLYRARAEDPTVVLP